MIAGTGALCESMMEQKEIYPSSWGFFSVHHLFLYNGNRGRTD